LFGFIVSCNASHHPAPAGPSISVYHALVATGGQAIPPRTAGLHLYLPGEYIQWRPDRAIAQEAAKARALGQSPLCFFSLAGVWLQGCGRTACMIHRAGGGRRRLHHPPGILDEWQPQSGPDRFSVSMLAGLFPINDQGNPQGPPFIRLGFNTADPGRSRRSSGPIFRPSSESLKIRLSNLTLIEPKNHQGFSFGALRMSSG